MMWPRGGPLEDGAAAAVDSGHIDKQEQPRQRIFALLITARARAPLYPGYRDSI